MRILKLSHGYPPTISGVTLVVQKIAQQLVQRGHTVTVITAGEDRRPYRYQDKGVQVIRLSAISNPFWKEGPMAVVSLPALQRMIAEFQPDLIHSHDIAWLGVQIVQLGKKIGVKQNGLPGARPPLLCSSYMFPDFVSHYVKLNKLPERLLKSITWRYLLAQLNCYDHTIFSTQIQRQLYIDHGLHVPSTVISNGVDLQAYFPCDGTAYRSDGGADAAGSDADIERRYALPDGPRLLFNGRLAVDKSIDILIQSMPRLWEARHAHLLLVGRGDYQSNLEELAHRLQVDHCVHFLGFIPEEDLPAIYRLSDLFVIASTCEVQSIPGLKALASGLPLVAADAGALPELVHDGKNGFLVSPDDPQAFTDAVLRALDGPEPEFRQESLAISRAHSDKNTLDALESLYQQLVASILKDQVPK